MKPASGAGLVDAPALIRLSKLTRPWMRKKRRVRYRLAKLLLAVACPKGRRHAGLVVHDVPGGRMALDLSASLEYSLFFRGCHEPEIGSLIERSAPEGGVCLDVGANVGAHTLVMARAVGPRGRVIALEPHPEICARLRRNLELNGLEQVEVVEAALFDADGERTLHGFARGAFQQGISSLVDGIVEGGESLEVRTVTARTLAGRHGLERCDLVKIDAEGAEPAILRELDPLIESSRPFLIFEIRRERWVEQGEDLDRVLRRLRELDYELHSVRRDATVKLEGRPPDSCELYCVPARRPEA